MDGELAFAGAGTHPSEAIANLATTTLTLLLLKKSNRVWAAPLQQAETGRPPLFNALSDQQTTQYSKKYAIPSELPQGICVLCV